MKLFSTKNESYSFGDTARGNMDNGDFEEGRRYSTVYLHVLFFSLCYVLAQYTLEKNMACKLQKAVCLRMWCQQGICTKDNNVKEIAYFHTLL